MVISNGNNNPVISWSANKEPDISGYRVYKKLTTSSGTQTTYVTTTGTSSTDTDFIITSSRLATDSVEYWVVAVDKNNHLSPESTHIIKTGESLIQWKSALDGEINETLYKFSIFSLYSLAFSTISIPSPKGVAVLTTSTISFPPFSTPSAPSLCTIF